MGEEAFIPGTDTQDWALFLFEELGWDQVKLQLGARLDNRETTVLAPELPDRDFDDVSSSIGVVYLPTSTSSLGLSVARAVKFPSSEELYSDGLHIATGAFEIGDPNLDAETSLGFDLSYRRTGTRVSGDVTVFAQDFDQFIFQRFTGEEDEEGFPVIAYSQADAEFRGGEVELRLGLIERAEHHADLRVFGDYVAGSADRRRERPAADPAARATAPVSTSTARASTPWSRRATARTRIDWLRTRRRPRPTRCSTPPSATGCSPGRRFTT